MVVFLGHMRVFRIFLMLLTGMPACRSLWLNDSMVVRYCMLEVFLFRDLGKYGLLEGLYSR